MAMRIIAASGCDEALTIVCGRSGPLAHFLRNSLILLVRTAGVEPAQPRGRGILSPLRLPVSPRPLCFCFEPSPTTSADPGNRPWLAASVAALGNDEGRAPRTLEHYRSV